MTGTPPIPATTIFQLPNAAPINGSEYVPITQNGVTVKTSIGSIAAGVGVASINSLVGPINITSSGGTINVTTSGNNINVDTSGSGAYVPLPITVTTASSQNTAANNGYVANNSGLLLFTLPLLANVGADNIFIGYGSGGWKLNQNANQNVIFGSVQTTPGVTGSITTQNQYDMIWLKCIIANTTWVVVSSQGNLTVT